jgi:CheY-like chemotaxis protein
MFPHGIRFLAGIALLTALLSQALAQDDKGAPPKDDKAPPANGKDKDKPQPKAEPPKTDDYRELFKKPETSAEFLKAIQFEMEVGRYDLAAVHVHNFLASNPTDKDLADLEDSVGMAPFLRLRNVPKWSSDAKAQDQAKKDVNELIDKVSAAVRKQRGDPQRIAMFIKNLTATEEERAFALKELYRSGALAIPPLIDDLRRAQGGDRAVLLDALQRLARPETVPPMVAALDSNDATLQLELIDVFRKGAATDAVPSLWFLAGSPDRPEIVRRRASDALATLLGVPAGKLASAKVALTQEADRYYKHEVPFANPAAVTVWRWDGNRVVAGWPGAETVPASRAEEYYGLRFAKQALALDPVYAPPQVVALSLALDKAYEKGDLSQPLAKVAPAVQDLAATVSPDLLTAVLDRALTEQRMPVILGAVRMLGDREEVRANLPAGKGEPPLVRALFYPDRRISLAAAFALLRIPSPQPANVSVRIVDVLRRALAAEPQARAAPRVLVAFANADVTNKVADALVRAGYDPVPAATGRDVLRRLNAASDIDVLLLDVNLPEPGLASLLAQLRADPNFGRLPVLLAATPECLDAMQRYAEHFPNVNVILAALALDGKAIKEQIGFRLVDAGGGPPAGAEVKDDAERAVRALARMAKGELKGYDFGAAADALFEALRAARLSPAGQTAAVEAVGRLPGPKPQTELLDVVLDGKRPVPLRLAATTELVRNIQKNGPNLSRAQVEALAGLHAQPGTDANLRANVALVLGSLRPDARASGELLLKYQPPTPGAPAPAKEEKPAPEK